MALVCPSCTVLNPVDAQFCHDCGESLASQTTTVSPWRALNQQRQTPSQTCPRCSTVNEPGSAYCYSCGLPLGDDAQPSQGATAYAAPVSGRPFRSLRTRANWTVGLIVVNCIVTVLTMYGAYQALDMAWKAEDGQYSSLLALESALFDLYGFYVLELITYIPAIIAFLMWLNRASKNLQLLGVHDQRFSSGWAVGWWFVPIMSLFRPYQVVKEIWKGSRAVSQQDSWEDWTSTSASPMLTWWWWIWLIANIAFGATLAEYETLDEIPGQLTLEIVVLSIWILAGLLAIAIVHRITRNQEEGHRRLTTG